MPFVARPLLCAAVVNFRAFAAVASFSFLLASEQKRLPSRPPLESAVMVRLTWLRSTIRPSRLRCSGPSCRLSTWQMRFSLATVHLRASFARAVNGCVTTVGVPVCGVYVATTVPRASNWRPFLTNLFTLNLMLTFPYVAADARDGPEEPSTPAGVATAVAAPAARIAVRSTARHATRFIRPPLFESSSVCDLSGWKDAETRMTSSKRTLYKPTRVSARRQGSRPDRGSRRAW